MELNRSPCTGKKSFHTILSTTCCIYFTLSIPLRLAFIPNFILSIDHIWILIPDLASTLFFSIDIIQNQLKIRSPKVLPKSYSRSVSTESMYTSTSTMHQSTLRLRCIPSLYKVPFFAILATLPLEYITFAAPSKITNYLMLNRILGAFICQNTYLRFPKF